jgi:FADH2 O2-dependent halogenase
MSRFDRGHFDIAVVGSGFGGSLLAMIARRLGRSVVLIERGRHPRFAIGESSTPLANLLLEQLARRYDLSAVAPLSKWGTWQKEHPRLGCGLKRGFTFFHHVAGRPWSNTPEHTNELLVTASPHDGVADTHWYRPDFDHFLVRQAQGMGVEFLDEAHLEAVRVSGPGVELDGSRGGRPFTLRAGFVIDASGPRGFLHRALKLGESPFGAPVSGAGFQPAGGASSPRSNLGQDARDGRLEACPTTQALYSHFEGVRRWDALHPSREPPPYPVDDAALHHVFDGGWLWVLRFNNGLTSAGAAVTDALANELRFTEGEPAWRRLLDRLPSVREQFLAATSTLPFVHMPRIPFRSARAAGERWALLPSAAGFVDPLLSTGFPLTLLGVERLAGFLERGWPPTGLGDSLAAYERQTFIELDTTAALVGALYANMDQFEAFAALTKLYFAAAMFAETMRRLGRPERAGSFLLVNDPGFGPALRDCITRARRGGSEQERRETIDAVRKTITPFDLAGLGEASRRNWHPCRADDLLAAAPKLGVDRPALEQLLARCGFTIG